jgi:hypothetical protein
MTILSIGSRQADYRNRTIYCPNAALLAYGQRKAYRGCWISFKALVQPWPDEDGNQREPYQEHYIGRMFASAKPTHPLPTDKAKEYLAVLTLSDDLTFGMLRWADPNDVTEILDPKKEGYPDPAAFLNWFSGDGFDKAAKKPEVMLRLLEYGTVSASYIGDVDNRVAKFTADMKERDNG